MKLTLQSLLFVASTLVAAASVSAQIVVTSSIFPANGTSLYTRYIATGLGNVSIGSAGANQTWDFSAIKNGTNRVRTYATTSNANIPNANLEYFEPDLNGTGYYKITATEVEFVGFGGDLLNIGTSFELPFANGLVELKAPLNYQDTYNDTAYYKATINVADYPSLDSLLDALLGSASGLVVQKIRVTVHDNLTNTIDAYGKMTIDKLGEFDVLRQKEVRITDTKIEISGTFIGFPTGWIDPTTISGVPELPFGGLDTIVTYRFLNNTSKEPIATVLMKSATSNKVQSIEFKSNSSSSKSPFSTFEGSVTAYPNPVVNILNLEFKNFPKGKYQVKLYNIIGNEVWADSYDFFYGSQRVSVDVSTLAKGSYLYSVLDEHGRTLMTKRIMIAKP